jgi:hypothetical protein
MKTQRAVVERVGGKFKQHGLRGGGDAIPAFVQILLGQTDTPQQGRRVNAVFAKRSNCPSRGESGRRRQQAGPAVDHLHAPFSRPDLV